MTTSNPIFRNFDSADASDQLGRADADPMTMGGTVGKSVLLLVLLSIVAGGTAVRFSIWVPSHHGLAAYVLIRRTFAIAFFGAVGLVVITVLKKRIAPLTAPLFAAVEGIALGIASAAVNIRYPGIAMQALGLTVAMCMCLLIAYGAGWITLGATLRRKLSVAVCGAIAYCAGSLLLILAGVRGVPLLAGGIPGALVSIVVIAIPGTVLVATCDAAVQRASEGKPKYMEWYAALGIAASLVWIYYEMIELFMKARRQA